MCSVGCIVTPRTGEGIYYSPKARKEKNLNQMIIDEDGRMRNNVACDASKKGTPGIHRQPRFSILVILFQPFSPLALPVGMCKFSMSAPPKRSNVRASSAHALRPIPV